MLNKFSKYWFFILLIIFFSKTFFIASTQKLWMDDEFANINSISRLANIGSPSQLSSIRDYLGENNYSSIAFENIEKNPTSIQNFKPDTLVESNLKNLLVSQNTEKTPFSLYYSILAQIYQFYSNSSIISLTFVFRYFSIFISLLTLIIAYKLSQQLLSSSKERVVMMSFLVFHPVFSTISASINELVLVIFIFTVIQYLLVFFFKNHEKLNLTIKGITIITCLIFISLFGQFLVSHINIFSFAKSAGINFTDVWGIHLPSTLFTMFRSLQRVLFFAEIAALIGLALFIKINFSEKTKRLQIQYSIFGLSGLALMSIFSFFSNLSFSSTLPFIVFSAWIWPVVLKFFFPESWKFRSLALYLIIFFILIDLQNSFNL